MNDDYDDAGDGSNVKPDTNTRSLTSLHISPMKTTQPTAARSKSLVFIPFNKLMSDVSIVVSGIANPDRQELRDKALEMGAQYYPDWIESATHLICRFTNTPKFVSVCPTLSLSYSLILSYLILYLTFTQAQKTGGIIVTPAWIVDCYAKKARLPETEYLLAEVKKKDEAIKSTLGSMRDWLSSYRPNFNST